MSDERSETAESGGAVGAGSRDPGATPAGERSGVVDLRPAPAGDAVAVQTDPRLEPDPLTGADREPLPSADPGSPIGAAPEPHPGADLGPPIAAAPAPDPGADPGLPIRPPTEPGEDALRLAEALVFASAAPVSARALSQLLPDTADAEVVIAALRARYAGRGVELVDVGNGVQFRTAPDLAPRLRKVIEIPRRLPRVAMETLAIIAYHQPVTRAEVEDIRGTSLSQQTLDALLEAGLVAPKGRKETPGRPTLWGTTPQFLAQFGLKDMRELPRREDLVLEPPQPAPNLIPEVPEAAVEDQTVTPEP